MPFEKKDVDLIVEAFRDTMHQLPNRQFEDPKDWTRGPIKSFKQVGELFQLARSGIQRVMVFAIQLWNEYEKLESSTNAKIGKLKKQIDDLKGIR